MYVCAVSNKLCLFGIGKCHINYDFIKCVSKTSNKCNQINNVKCKKKYFLQKTQSGLVLFSLTIFLITDGIARKNRVQVH